MTPLYAAALASQVAAAASAAMLARRRPSHAPAAVALALLAAVTIAHVPVLAALTPYSAEPWEGVGRVLVYIDGAMSLATSATMAGLCVAVAVSHERRRRAALAVALVWLLASVVLGALYPSPMVRGASLQRVYFAAELVGIFVATVALLVKGSANIAAKLSPDATWTVGLFLVLLDAGLLLAPFSPWRNALFGADFKGVQFLLTASFAIVTIVQVTLWKYTSRT